MLNRFLHEVYVSAIPIILITMLVLLIVWSVFGAVFYQKMRKVSMVAAILSAAVILYVTLFSRSIGARSYNLIPFSSFQRAVENPELYRTMLMNVFLFMPLGLALPFVFKGSTGKRILLTIEVGFVLSITVEALQGFLALGMVETDDVICNTLGAAIGCCAYLLSIFWSKLINKTLDK